MNTDIEMKDDHPEYSDYQSNINDRDIYKEASQWLRTCHNILWSITTVFIPTSMAAALYALQHNNGIILAGGILLYLVWFYLFYYYGYIALSPRKVLEDIEQKNNFPDILKMYTHQHRYIYGLLSLKYSPIIFTIIYFVVCTAIYKHIL
ncbi:hypothetical protein [Vibrio quintilis]|uniref:Uncharacterized protein n=1 Tax=Vibrio quintilis TaxID=1117707 RepID=A0A1M7YPW7_9VIBR|nr:hypothetical protein [Vibrio quintilis]SHO54650.1 hypothetical protein VQ7734_00364 [Vibrio quintilis]